MADSLLQYAAALALDSVFPPRCAACSTLLASDNRAFPSLFCEPCETALPQLRAPLCACCGTPDNWEHPSHRCADCRAHPPAFEALRSLYDFRGGVREAIHALKYRGQTALAAPLAQRLATLFDDAPVPRACLLVAVPLHPWRRWRRGFNQSEVIAQQLARVLRVRSNSTSICAPRVLRRVRWTAPQVELDEEQRAANVSGAFAADATALRALPRLPIVLVDDVTTTGATLDECARTLRAAGATQIFAVTFARRL